MNNITIFGLKLTVNPVAFKFPESFPLVGGFEVRWYGILIALGFLLAVIYGMRNAKRLGVDPDRMLDVVLITTPLAILCARAYFCLFYKALPGEEIDTFGEFFGLGNSNGLQGLAIYGGVIGAAVFGFIACKLRKVNVFAMFDLASLGFLIGQGIGRWGNFTNQEAYGYPTGSSWFGMTSEAIQQKYGKVLVHPCFLYESIWCLVGFFLLHKLSKKRRFNGEIALMYCIWYGFGRFFIEFLRTDSLPLGDGKLRVSALLSALLVVSCGIILFLARRRTKAVADSAEYKSMFELQNDTVEQSSDEEYIGVFGENEEKEKIESEENVENE